MGKQKHPNCNPELTCIYEEMVNTGGGSSRPLNSQSHVTLKVLRKVSKTAELEYTVLQGLGNNATKQGAIAGVPAHVPSSVPSALLSYLIPTLSAMQSSVSL